MKLNWVIFIFLFFPSFFFSQIPKLKASGPHVDRLWCDNCLFSIDSVFKHKTINIKIIGEWNCRSNKIKFLQEDTLSKIKTNAVTTFDIRADKIIYVIYEDGKKRKMYWNYSEDETTLFIYQSVSEKIIANISWEFKIMKLSKHKLHLVSKPVFESQGKQRGLAVLSMEFKK